MYRCSFCKKCSQPRVACHKVTIKSKMHQHPYRARIQKRWGIDKSGRKKLEWVDDHGGSGYQIGIEVNSCPDCAAKYEVKREDVSLIVKPTTINFTQNQMIYAKLGDNRKSFYR